MPFLCGGCDEGVRVANFSCCLACSLKCVASSVVVFDLSCSSLIYVFMFLCLFLEVCYREAILCN